MEIRLQIVGFILFCFALVVALAWLGTIYDQWYTRKRKRDTIRNNPRFFLKLMKGKDNG